MVSEAEYQISGLRELKVTLNFLGDIRLNMSEKKIYYYSTLIKYVLTGLFVCGSCNCVNMFFSISINLKAHLWT